MKKLFQKVKLFFAGRKLKRALLNRRYQRETVTLEEAKRIAILFSAYNEEDIKTAEAYIQSLRNEGKEIEYIAYIGIKNYLKLHKGQAINPNYIFDRDFDFFHRPKRKFIEKFFKERFDILISLNHSNNFSINYIASLSAARMRVGKYAENAVNAYDFMIDDGGQGMAEYIDQLKHYLQKLRK